jgi:hypothetical protein
MKAIIDFVGSIGILAFVLMLVLGVVLGIWFLYHVECETPRQEEVLLAYRVMATWLKATDASDGAIHTARTFQAGQGQGILQEFRVFARRSSAGDEVVIQPQRWCACRPTLVVSDGGRKIK